MPHHHTTKGFLSLLASAKKWLWPTTLCFSELCEIEQFRSAIWLIHLALFALRARGCWETVRWADDIGRLGVADPWRGNRMVSALAFQARPSSYFNFLL